MRQQERSDRVSVLARAYTLASLAAACDCAATPELSKVYGDAYERRLALLGVGAIAPCELYS